MSTSLHKQRIRYVQALESAVQTIQQRLSHLPEVERVFLFGSYARGRRDLQTDLDLIVIMRTDRPFLDRLTYLYSYLCVPVDLDLLCYTPEEWETLQHRPFFRYIQQQAVVLYEKKSA